MQLQAEDGTDLLSAEEIATFEMVRPQICKHHEVLEELRELYIDPSRSYVPLFKKLVHEIIHTYVEICINHSFCPQATPQLFFSVADIKQVETLRASNIMFSSIVEVAITISSYYLFRVPT